MGDPPLPPTRFLREHGGCGQATAFPLPAVPRHTTKTTAKKLTSASQPCCKTWPVVWPRTRPRDPAKDICFHTAPLPGKNESSTRSMTKGNGLSSSALSEQLTAFRQAHTPATPSLTRASFQTTSPCPFSHTSTSGTGSKGCPPHHASLSKDHMSGFWGMGEFEGEGPFFPPEKGPFPLKSIFPLPQTHHCERTKSRMRSSL